MMCVGERLHGEKGHYNSTHNQVAQRQCRKGSGERVSRNDSTYGKDYGLLGSKKEWFDAVKEKLLIDI